MVTLVPSIWLFFLPTLLFGLAAAMIPVASKIVR